MKQGKTVRTMIAKLPKDPDRVALLAQEGALFVNDIARLASIADYLAEAALRHAPIVEKPVVLAGMVCPDDTWAVLRLPLLATWRDQTDKGTQTFVGYYPAISKECERAVWLESDGELHHAGPCGDIPFATILRGVEAGALLQAWNALEERVFVKGEAFGIKPMGFVA